MELGQQHALLAAAVTVAVAILMAGYMYKADCSSEQSEIVLLKRTRDDHRNDISWYQNKTASLNRDLGESMMKISQLEEENDSLGRDLKQAKAAAKHYRKTLNGDGKLLGIRITTPVFSIGAAIDNPFRNDSEPYGYLD